MNSVYADTISSTGFKSALDNLHCATLILNNKAEALYCNHSAQFLLQRCHISINDFVNQLNQQINLSVGKGRFSFTIQNISFVCNVYPWINDGQRIGNTLILHDEANPDCSAMTMNLITNMLQEINTLLEASYDGIIVTDKNGCITRMNKAASESLHIEKRDTMGRNVSDLIQAQIIDRSVALEVIHSRKSASDIITNTEGVQLLVSGTPVFDEKSQLASVIINLRNFSELDELRRKLENQQLMTEAYQRELVRLTHKIPDNIIVCSKKMQQLFNTIDAVSSVDSTILITGESGVGKEVIVNQIQSTSTRKNKPFIKINCGAIPSNLFESEMFGYEEGSFTGARKKGKAGFFEMANGGTLFMDEIGELSMKLQVKLLRAIQEGEFTRLGGTQTIRTDVRLIAATNRDLWQMTQEGTFRQDLYYRLNVISLRIPPLRERREDIIPLAASFVERFNKKFNKNKQISMELGNVLRCLDWPGNIRELENLMETLVVLVQEDNLLKPEHLPERYMPSVTAVYSPAKPSAIMPLKEALEITETELFKAAQKEYHSTRAIAEVLGISQATVSRKMRQLGLYPPFDS